LLFRITTASRRSGPYYIYYVIVAGKAPDRTSADPERHGRRLWVAAVRELTR